MACAQDAAFSMRLWTNNLPAKLQRMHLPGPTGQFTASFNSGRFVRLQFNSSWPENAQQSESCGVRYLFTVESVNCSPPIEQVSTDLWDRLLTPLAVDQMIQRLENSLAIARYVQTHFPARCHALQLPSNSSLGAVAEANWLFLNSCMEPFCKDTRTIYEKFQYPFVV
jgi:hypothetical protein